MSYDDLFEYVRKQCTNCSLWDERYEAYLPTGAKTIFGPEVTRTCLYRAGSDGPDVASDPLLSEVHTGKAFALTASDTCCGNWKPTAQLLEDLTADRDEYEQVLAWHHQRGLYPGSNCPPL